MRGKGKKRKLDRGRVAALFYHFISAGQNSAFPPTCSSIKPICWLGDQLLDAKTNPARGPLHFRLRLCTSAPLQSPTVAHSFLPCLQHALPYFAGKLATVNTIRQYNDRSLLDMELAILAQIYMGPSLLIIEQLAASN